MPSSEISDRHRCGSVEHGRCVRIDRRRRQFVAPGRPPLALLAGKQFEIGPRIQPLDPAVDLVGLFAVLADR